MGSVRARSSPFYIWLVLVLLSLGVMLNGCLRHVTEDNIVGAMIQVLFSFIVLVGLLLYRLIAWLAGRGKRERDLAEWSLLPPSEDR